MSPLQPPRSPPRAAALLALLVGFVALAPSLASAAMLADDENPTVKSQLVPQMLVAVIVVAVLVGIYFARQGRILPLRAVTALSAFEEAVSRATEMGRPTLFTTGGTCELNKIQLYASMPLLRKVAEISAELGNRLIVPVGFPQTMPVHLNAVRDGYIQAGALENFRVDDVRFLPGGQFFFAIGAMGWMLEEQPAACFYFGYWEADSLLFAETGQTVNALQIAGTDALYQVPFFVASCDYTMIGEEFWAASASVSRDADLLGSLGAQDLLKIAILSLVVIGTLMCLVPKGLELVQRVQEELK